MPAKVAQVDEMLTADEVADVLSVSVKSISNWSRQGRFPGAFKVGGGKTSHWRIPRSGLDFYLKEQRAQAVTA